MKVPTLHLKAKKVKNHNIEKLLDLFDLKPGFTEAQLKQSYRLLVQVWHPDRFSQNPKLRQKAEEKLKVINNSYKVLSDYLKTSDLESQQQKDEANSEFTETTNENVEHDGEKEKGAGNSQATKGWSSWFTFGISFFIIIFLVVIYGWLNSLNENWKDTSYKENPFANLEGEKNPFANLEEDEPKKKQKIGFFDDTDVIEEPTGFFEEEKKIPQNLFDDIPPESKKHVESTTSKESEEQSKQQISNLELKDKDPLLSSDRGIVLSISEKEIIIYSYDLKMRMAYFLENPSQKIGLKQGDIVHIKYGYTDTPVAFRKVLEIENKFHRSVH